MTWIYFKCPRERTRGFTVDESVNCSGKTENGITDECNQLIDKWIKKRYHFYQKRYDYNEYKTHKITQYCKNDIFEKDFGKGKRRYKWAVVHINVFGYAGYLKDGHKNCYRGPVRSKEFVCAEEEHNKDDLKIWKDYCACKSCAFNRSTNIFIMTMRYLGCYLYKPKTQNCFKIWDRKVQDPFLVDKARDLYEKK